MGVSITAETVVECVPGLLTAQIGEELVVLGPDRSTYYGLDDIGTAVWTLLAQPTAVAMLCRALSTEYEAQPADIERDLIVLLDQLEQHGLIRRVEHAAVGRSGSESSL